MPELPRWREIMPWRKFQKIFHWACLYVCTPVCLSVFLSACFHFYLAVFLCVCSYSCIFVCTHVPRQLIHVNLHWDKLSHLNPNLATIDPATPDLSYFPHYGVHFFEHHSFEAFSSQ